MTKQLWLAHSDSICNYFKKRTGDRALSCDLMQDTFRKALDHREKLEQIDNHQAWLYRIARNRLIDHTRKIKESALPDTTIPDNNQDMGGNESNINDIAKCLHQLIEEYEGEEQEILVKVFQKSLTQKEVAQYLDIPYSTFKSRIQKVRQEIIEEFNKRCCQLRYDSRGYIIGCAPA